MVDRSEYIIDTAIAEGMEVLLAEEIRKYPVLYDKNAKQKCGLSFQQQCNSAWNKISDELNLELDSCKSLWSCMKQKFIKHRKRLDNGEQVPLWPTYNALHKWLDQHVKKRKSRNDYIKQMKSGPKLEQIKNSSDNDDEGNATNEEWTEILNEKTVKIQLKRKSQDDESNDNSSQTPLAKASSNNSKICSGSTRNEKKFKIEVISDGGTTIIDSFDESREDDAEEQETSVKEADIVVLEQISTAESMTQHIEVIELKKTSKNDDDDKVIPIAANEIDKNINKIEKFLCNCINLIERCNAESDNTCDSNTAFGKYIASMVRELPSEKHLKIRLNILQYASELITKESVYSKN